MTLEQRALKRRLIQGSNAIDPGESPAPLDATIPKSRGWYFAMGVLVGAFLAGIAFSTVA